MSSSYLHRKRIEEVTAKNTCRRPDGEEYFRRVKQFTKEANASESNIHVPIGLPSRVGLGLAFDLKA